MMIKNCNNCKYGFEGLCNEVQAPYTSEISSSSYCNKWRFDFNIKQWFRILGRNISEAFKEDFKI